MPSDVEEEFPVSSGVGELVLGRTAKWNAAQNEGAGAAGEFLLAAFSFFADKVDGLQSFEPKLRDTQRWQCGSERREGHVCVSGEPRTPPFDYPFQCVLKMFQKCSKSPCNRPEKGSRLSESRSPELV